jgi:hypothetical protein
MIQGKLWGAHAKFKKCSSQSAFNGGTNGLACCVKSQGGYLDAEVQSGNYLITPRVPYDRSIRMLAVCANL